MDRKEIAKSVSLVHFSKIENILSDLVVTDVKDNFVSN